MLRKRRCCYGLLKRNLICRVCVCLDGIWAFTDSHWPHYKPLWCFVFVKKLQTITDWHTRTKASNKLPRHTLVTHYFTPQHFRCRLDKRALFFADMLLFAVLHFLFLFNCNHYCCCCYCKSKQQNEPFPCFSCRHIGSAKLEVTVGKRQWFSSFCCCCSVLWVFKQPSRINTVYCW